MNVRACCPQIICSAPRLIEGDRILRLLRMLRHLVFHHVNVHLIIINLLINYYVVTQVFLGA
jgi:hypothetical protein